MKNILTATFLTCICITGSAQINHGYPIDPVPFTSVKVTEVKGTAPSSKP